jgi:hypothetical protein
MVGESRKRRLYHRRSFPALMNFLSVSSGRICLWTMSDWAASPNLLLAGGGRADMTTLRSFFFLTVSSYYSLFIPKC